MSKSVGQLFREKVSQHGDRPALFSRDGAKWRSVSWIQFDRNVRARALALDAMGLKRGDAVAIVANTGGAGALAADACGDHGLQVVRLSAATRRKLRWLLPSPRWARSGRLGRR